MDHGMRLKLGIGSQSVHFKNHDVLIYTHSPSDGESTSRGTISAVSEPKVLNKRDGPVGECTKREESAAEMETREGRGWMGGRDQREST